MPSIATSFLAAVAAAVPGRQVSDGQVLSQPDPTGHVVVFCPEGDVQMGSITGDVDGKSVVARVQSFGPTRESAGWLSRHITDALISDGVSVPGWGRAWVQEHYNRPPSSDEDVKEFPVVMFYDEFHMTFAKAD